MGAPTPRFGPDEFAAATNVSRETLSRLRTFADLLMKWQRAINLVAPGDIGDLWHRHILDSAQLLPLLPPPPAGRSRVIADLGSGAGFPGLILSIMGAGRVHLFESDARKCAFLSEAVRLTGADAMVHNLRIEAVAQAMPALRADVVTARGLASLSELLALAAPLIEKGGVCLFPKGKSAASELTAAGKEWNITVEQLPSRTDRSGVILRIGGLAIERSTQHSGLRKP